MCAALTRGTATLLVAVLAVGLATKTAFSAELAREVLDGPMKVEVIRVIDGDTIVVRVHPWLGLFIESRVRLARIDAPELRGRSSSETTLAGRAKDRLGQLLASGTAHIDHVRPDKYGGRVRAHVLDSSGVDVGAVLIAAGLARPYHGERRKSWCADQG